MKDLENSLPDGVREFANKSAASPVSLDYTKFQAVIKSAASAASPHGGRASGRLDHDLRSLRGDCASSRLDQGLV